MKKILFISGSKKFTRTALGLVKSLQEDEPFFLVGAFSHSLNYAELADSAVFPYSRLVVELLEQDKEAVTENIRLFEHSCKCNGIKYRVHEEQNNFELNELINESRFADLVVVDEKSFGE